MLQPKVLHNGKEAYTVYMVKIEMYFCANLMPLWKNNLANGFKYSCWLWSLKKGFFQRSCTYLDFTIFLLSAEGFDFWLYKRDKFRTLVLPIIYCLHNFFFASIAWCRSNLKVTVPSVWNVLSQLWRCGVRDGLKDILLYSSLTDWNVCSFSGGRMRLDNNSVVVCHQSGKSGCFHRKEGWIRHELFTYIMHTGP